MTAPRPVVTQEQLQIIAGYIVALYGAGKTRGKLVGCIRVKMRDGSFIWAPRIWTDDPMTLAGWIARAAPFDDVYVGIATQDWERAKPYKQAKLDEAKRKWEADGCPPDRKRRWTADEQNCRGFNHTTLGLPGVLVDVDLARPGAHATNDLPGTLDEVLEATRAVFPLEPTIIVSSGYGLYLGWMFREVWEFEAADDCLDRAEASALVVGLQKLLRGAWIERGWLLDPTHDGARVLRPVGSFNHKLGEARLVEIVGGSRQRYNPGDLLEWIPAGLVDEGRRENAGRKRDAVVGLPAELVPMIAGCAWLRHCRDDAATLREPEWYAMLGILGRCHDGKATAHEWSAAYPGYDETATDEKIEQALTAIGWEGKTVGPALCETIAEKLDGAPHCAGCVARINGARSPISLGYQTRARAASSSAGVQSLVERVRLAMGGGDDAE